MTDQNLTPEVGTYQPFHLPNQKGGWVRYVPASDYDALAQQNAALQAEVERLTKERDEALASLASERNEAIDWLAARLVDWWGKNNLESNEFLDEFIPAAKANIPDAQAALDRMLADAERDMRQMAADIIEQHSEAVRSSNNLRYLIPRQNGSQTGLAYRATILALPLRHAGHGD